jgi:hypothetical protein
MFVNGIAVRPRSKELSHAEWLRFGKTLGCDVCPREARRFAHHSRFTDLTCDFNCTEGSQRQGCWDGSMVPSPCIDVRAPASAFGWTTGVPFRVVMQRGARKRGALSIEVQRAVALAPCIIFTISEAWWNEGDGCDRTTYVVESKQNLGVGPPPDGVCRLQEETFRLSRGVKHPQD